MDGFNPAWEGEEDLEAEVDPDLDDDGIPETILEEGEHDDEEVQGPRVGYGC